MRAMRIGRMRARSRARGAARSRRSPRGTGTGAVWVRVFVPLALLVLALFPATATEQRWPQEELRAGNLLFRYPPSQRRAAAALVRSLEIPVRMPGLPPDALAREDILVYLAPDEATFQELAPGAPDWSGAIAFPQGDSIVLPTYGPRAGGTPLATVLRHELAHVALNRYLGARVPRWFHEGYAQLASSSWGADQAWTLRIAILLGQVPSLDSLGLEFRRQRIAADKGYLLSYTVVEYLQRLGGATGFEQLLRRWRELGDLDPALRRTFGVTLGQFEQMWRRDLRRRYGWLLLLTQTVVFWTALTIALLILGYWKRRRDRWKLAALDAAVRARELSPGEGVTEGEAGGADHIPSVIDGDEPST